MRKIVLTTALAVLLALALPTRHAAAADDETFESAVWLLKKSTLVHRDGMHNVLLRALRQLRDPDLQPMFSGLVQSRVPEMKIHGILGLAEIAAQRQIDLALVADTKSAATQAQLVSWAIEGKLLTLEQAEQLISWPGLDSAVKMIVATDLAGNQKPTDDNLLTESLDSGKAAMRGMAAVLKMQAGDASAIEYLKRIDATDDATRDTVRAMLLQTAIRYKFDAIAPWAMSVATEPKSNLALTFLAMRAAMMFKAPGASAAWQQRFTSSTSEADQIRLAMLALDVAEQVEPELFDALLAHPQELIQQMGRVGKKISQQQPSFDELTALLKMNHVLSSKWILQYAGEIPLDQGQAILVAIIEAAEGEPNPARFRAQRLEDTVLATQQLAESLPEAKSVIQPLIQQVPMLTQEAMLMGLIRATEIRASDLIDGIDEWKSETAASLALLLRAKHGQTLTAPQLQQLGLIVRGGAGLQDPLRVQAAWSYLKLTNQAQLALADLLGG